jgi:hypothetical protein
MRSVNYEEWWSTSKVRKSTTAKQYAHVEGDKYREEEGAPRGGGPQRDREGG